MSTQAPQIILAGHDLSVLNLISVDDLWQHRERVSQELLAAKRIQAGWSREAVSASNACMLAFPDADPRDIPVLAARLTMLDIIVSRRTGQRVRTVA